MDQKIHAYWSDVSWTIEREPEKLHGYQDKRPGCRHLFSYQVMVDPYIGFLVEANYIRGNIKIDPATIDTSLLEKELIGGKYDILTDVTDNDYVVKGIQSRIGVTNKKYPFKDGFFIRYDGSTARPPANSWNTLVLRIWMRSLLYTDGVGIKSLDDTQDTGEAYLADSRTVAEWYRQYGGEYPDYKVFYGQSLCGIIFWAEAFKQYIAKNNLDISCPVFRSQGANSHVTYR